MMKSLRFICAVLALCVAVSFFSLSAFAAGEDTKKSYDSAEVAPDDIFDVPPEDDVEAEDTDEDDDGGEAASDVTYAVPPEEDGDAEVEVEICVTLIDAEGKSKWRVFYGEDALSDAEAWVIANGGDPADMVLVDSVIRTEWEEDYDDEEYDDGEYDDEEYDDEEYDDEEYDDEEYDDEEYDDEEYDDEEYDDEEYDDEEYDDEEYDDEEYDDDEYDDDEYDDEEYDDDEYDDEEYDDEEYDDDVEDDEYDDEEYDDEEYDDDVEDDEYDDEEYDNEEYDDEEYDDDVEDDDVEDDEYDDEEYDDEEYDDEEYDDEEYDDEEYDDEEYDDEEYDDDEPDPCSYCYYVRTDYYQVELKDVVFHFEIQPVEIDGDVPSSVPKEIAYDPAVAPGDQTGASAPEDAALPLPDGVNAIGGAVDPDAADPADDAPDADLDGAAPQAVPTGQTADHTALIILLLSAGVLVYFMIDGKRRRSGSFGNTPYRK